MLQFRHFAYNHFESTIHDMTLTAQTTYLTLACLFKCPNYSDRAQQLTRVDVFSAAPHDLIEKNEF